MVFYYRLSGLIADYAIVVNLILLLLGAMALMNATLTLPGIAGIILTIGMGVDFNVLMFEHASARRSAPVNSRGLHRRRV